MICLFSYILSIIYFNLYILNFGFFHHVLIIAIRSFLLISGVLTFANFVKFQKKGMKEVQQGEYRQGKKCVDTVF